MSTADQTRPIAGAPSHPALVSLKYITKSASCSNSNVWKQLRDGKFPPPAIRGPRFTRWRKTDVDAWLANPEGWSFDTRAVAAQVVE